MCFETNFFSCEYFKPPLKPCEGRRGQERRGPFCECSGLRSNGPMHSLAPRAGLVVPQPEPSFSPCARLYCGLAAAPSAGGPAAAERDVLKSF